LHKKITLYGLNFSVLSLKDASEEIVSTAKDEKSGLLIVTVNVDVLMLCRRDPEFREICEDAAMVLADGMPIIWTSHIAKCALPQRVTGVDLVPAIAEVAARRGARIYILGGREGAASSAARRLSEQFSGLTIAGTDCPPFGFERDPVQSQEIVNRINDARVDILFIGVGAPKQEKWISAHLRQLNVGAIVCVGAAIEFQAGLIRRAPRLLQICGFEWIWRLCLEPRRLWRRYLVRDVAFVPIMVGEIYRRRAERRRAAG
jgi:N-acetylglucosaminyldiphosphoundecaprenol N-acetyl-beta-D-mannosaminyltransferase